MEVLLELVCYATIEILLYCGAEIIVEMLAEFGFKKFKTEPDRKSYPVWLKLLASFMWGCVLGGISLVIFNEHLIVDANLRLLNLLLVPILVGAMMMQLGRAKEKYGKQRLRLDYFGYAALFAFGISLMRYVFI